MKKIAAFAFAMGLLGLSTAAFAQRLAYVDVKKAFDAYTGTQTAKDKLKKQVDEEKAKLEKDQDGLKKKLNDLKAKESVLPKEKYKTQEEAIMVEIRALQERIQTTTADLQQQEAKLTSQIVDLIKEATAKVAKKEKYDFVFEASNILYGGDEITSSVIKELNSK